MRQQVQQVTLYDNADYGDAEGIPAAAVQAEVVYQSACDMCGVVVNILGPQGIHAASVFVENYEGRIRLHVWDNDHEGHDPLMVLDLLVAKG